MKLKLAFQSTAKFSEDVINGPRNRWLNLGDVPDLGGSLIFG